MVHYNPTVFSKYIMPTAGKVVENKVTSSARPWRDLRMIKSNPKHTCIYVCHCYSIQSCRRLKARANQWAKNPVIAPACTAALVPLATTWFYSILFYVSMYLYYCFLKGKYRPYKRRGSRYPCYAKPTCRKGVGIKMWVFSLVCSVNLIWNICFNKTHCITNC